MTYYIRTARAKQMEKVYKIINQKILLLGGLFDYELLSIS